MGDALIIQEPAGGTTGYLSGGTTILDGENAAAHAVIVPGEVTKFPVEVVVTTWDKDGNLISAVGGTATADKTEVARGETITVTATANPGFELESIEFSDGVTGGYQAGKETSSTVPDDFTTGTGKLQIDVIFKETPTEVTYPVWVGGEQATEANKDDILGDGKVKFDPATNTLTLNGAAINTDGMHASGAAIVSEGIDLTVTGSFTTSSTGYGIAAYGGNLTLDGVTATLDAIDLAIRADGNLTINGGSVTASAHEIACCGISAKNGITITDGAVTVTADGYLSNGMSAADISISGGKVNVTATGETSTGMTGDSITITNGEVTATGEAYGMIASNSVTISGGTVTAKSKMVGIEASAGNVIINNGTTSVTADGYDAAISAAGITIGDALMIKEPAGGKLSGDGKEILNADDTTATHALIVPKEVATHTVTFETDGGSAVPAQTVADGEKAVKPADPTKSGYVFDGWYADAAFSAAFDFDTPITADVTVYAKWTEESVTPPAPTTHTVTFETNGGSAVPAQTVADGEKAVKPADPTRSGFVFDGWYADAAFSAAFDFDTPITADVTVYAKWKEATSPVEISYKVVSGGNSTWTKGSSSGVTITVKRSEADDTCFSHFTGVQIDGTTLVNGTDYTAVAGSTVVTLNASALEKLATGAKTVTISFDDGKAATNLTIKAKSSGTDTGTAPNTGDDSNPALWLTIMALSGLGLLGLGVLARKCRYLSNH